MLGPAKVDLLGHDLTIKILTDQYIDSDGKTVTKEFKLCFMTLRYLSLFKALCMAKNVAATLRRPPKKDEKARDDINWVTMCLNQWAKL